MAEQALGIGPSGAGRILFGPKALANRKSSSERGSRRKRLNPPRFLQLTPPMDWSTSAVDSSLQRPRVTLKQLKKNLAAGTGFFPFFFEATENTSRKRLKLIVLLCLTFS